MAHSDSATLGASAYELYKNLTNFKANELHARMTYCETLAHQYIIVANLEVYDEDEDLYRTSPYKKIIDEIKAYSVKVDEAVNKMLVAVSKIAKPASDQPLPQAENKAAVKPNTHLDPGKFTNEDPELWNDWFEGYRRWFRASKLGNSDLDEQVGYLKLKINKPLFDRSVQLAPQGTHYNPLLNHKGSIFEIIEQNLATTNPLRSRRQNWYDILPQPGERPLNFLTRLTKAEEAAKMRSATIEDILVLKRMAALASNKDLTKEILRIDTTEANPLTVKTIYEVTAKWTRIDAELALTSQPSHTANVLRPRPTNSGRCQCCHSRTPSNQKLCGKCFKNGPPKTLLLCKM